MIRTDPTPPNIRKEPLMIHSHAALMPALVLLAVSVLSGCATLAPDTRDELGPKQAGDRLQVRCATNLTPEHRVELDAIDSMMASSHNYAALARLEALPFSTQQHWLRWAQLLAQVDQLDYSQDVYRQIAEACGSAEAYHGLGVVSVKAGRIEAGLDALSTAKALEPASADIRNDFGVVLMEAGFYGQAAFELRTAYELSGGKDSTGRSMVAAYYLHGGETSVARVRRELGLDDELVAAGIEFSKRFAGGS